MTKSNSALLELEMTADSGVVSTTPSEMNDTHFGDRDADFASSSQEGAGQEDDLGLGPSTTVSPKRSHSDAPANGYHSKLLSSTTASTATGKGANSVASEGCTHAAATPTKEGDGGESSSVANLTAAAGSDVPIAVNGVAD